MVHLSSDNPQTLPSHWHMVSRLVIFTYGPPPPTPKHEVDHIDEDKLNCHISNLQWMVHTLRGPAEDHRRRETCGRKPGFNHNPQTLEKMSLAKQKPVIVTGYGKTMIFDSIEELMDSKLSKQINLYRRKFNRIMNSGGEYHGYTFELSADVS